MGVKHKNLVSLIGYCNEGKNMAVIYEYMAKGNLKQHISGNNFHELVNYIYHRLYLFVQNLINVTKRTIIEIEMKPLSFYSFMSFYWIKKLLKLKRER